ncbi:hypothetical protein HYS30_00270 [Candidatus Peregrinibacteria bacterium]|nr:hypothetical protein [Candidatus Peregrinibacteria bacterium]
MTNIDGAGIVVIAIGIRCAAPTTPSTVIIGAQSGAAIGIETAPSSIRHARTLCTYEVVAKLRATFVIGAAWSTLWYAGRVGYTCFVHLTVRSIPHITHETGATLVTSGILTWIVLRHTQAFLSPEIPQRILPQPVERRTRDEAQHQTCHDAERRMGQGEHCGHGSTTMNRNHGGSIPLPPLLNPLPKGEEILYVLFSIAKPPPIVSYE